MREYFMRFGYVMDMYMPKAKDKKMEHSQLCAHMLSLMHTCSHSQETSEADVREYFMRFGYVMDVYMPKAKDNKMEHRGFGFVTFETEAAIQRVVGHGAHRLKGSTIAIDIAVPKVRSVC